MTFKAERIGIGDWSQSQPLTKLQRIKRIFKRTLYIWP